MRIPSHLLLAFGLLSLALFGSRGELNPFALLLVLLAFALTLAALARHTDASTGPAGVILILVLQFTALLARPGQMLPMLDAFWPRFQVGIGLACLVCLSYGLGLTRLAIWRFPILLLIFVLIGAGIIRNFPAPETDVWIFQQQGVRHLLAGENPYAATYPNPYPHDRFHGPEILKDNRIQSCPYPPWSLLLAIPGYLAGDIRWSMLAALAGTAVLGIALGRRQGMPAGDPAELVVVAFLYTPAGFLLLLLGWTEPLLALSAGLTLCGLAGASPAGRALGLASFLAAKQYGLFWLPAFRGHIAWRDGLIAIGLAGAIALPFFLWDPGAFWFGVVEFQFHQPFRDDALSIPAAIAAWTGYRLPSAVGLLAAVLVAGWIYWRMPRDRAKVPLAGAAILLALFLFNKQAFLNYYWLVQAFLMLGMMMSLKHKPVSEPASESPGQT